MLYCSWNWFFTQSRLDVPMFQVRKWRKDSIHVFFQVSMMKTTSSSLILLYMDALVTSISGNGRRKDLMMCCTPDLERKHISHFCILAIGWNLVMWLQLNSGKLAKRGLAKRKMYFGPWLTVSATVADT